MRALTILATIPAALSLAGCISMKTPMTQFATDYNRVIADSRNEMILLNIVRAKNREPRHFSTLSTVGGNMSIDGKLKIDTKNYFDGGANEASPSVEFNAKTNPTFQLIPLTTTDFVTGLLQPVGKDVIRTLLDQGFSNDLLAPLLIESIVCGDEVYRNDPRYFSAGKLTESDKALSAAQLFGIRFEIIPAKKVDGLETVRLSEFQNLGSMADFIQKLISGDSVTAGKSGAELNFKKATAPEISYDIDPKFQAAWNNLPACAEEVPAEGNIKDKDPVIYSTLRPSDSKTPPKNVLKGVLRIRSVDAIVYYLGEIMRYQKDGLRDPYQNQRVIFSVGVGADDKGAVQVKHRGTVYSIALPESASLPPEKALEQVDSRSLQAITLINHLIALQTSNDALKRAQTSISVN